VNAPRQQRDPFWLVLGGILGVLLVGLMVVVFIISSNSNSASPSAVAQATATTAVQGAPQAGNPTVAVDNPPVGAVDATPSEEPAPRMPLADFKALYDDPAKRPLIIDVRAKEAFDAGHIKGAESFPESDVDTRVKELPKDKLIVAYCQ